MFLHRVRPLVFALLFFPYMNAGAAQPAIAHAAQAQRDRPIAWLRLAEATAAQIQDKDSRLNAWYEIDLAMVDFGEFQAVAKLVDRLDDACRADVLTHLAAAQIKAGNKEGAKQTLGKALAHPKEYYAPTIAKLLAEAGATTDAAALIEKIKAQTDNQGKPLSPADRAYLLSDAGDLPAAAAALAKVGSSWDKGHLCAHLADAYIELGDGDRARQMLRLGRLAVERAGVDEVEAAKSQNEPRRSLAEVWISMGEFGEAEHLAGAIKEPSQAACVRMEIAIAQASRGDIEAAKAAAGRVQREDLASEASAEIAGALARAGRYDDARKMAKGIQMDDGRGHESRATAFREIGEAYAKTGDRQAARARFDGARAAAHVEVGFFERVFWSEDPDEQCIEVRALPAVAESQARAGDLDALANWVDSLPSPYVRALTYIGAARGISRK